jgi:endonuclease/exonuclease/phosphatase family metal-dependent hydrolase
MPESSESKLKRMAITAHRINTDALAVQELTRRGRKLHAREREDLAFLIGSIQGSAQAIAALAEEVLHAHYAR